jgi:Na+-driven multidrug efflux pump
LIMLPLAYFLPKITNLGVYGIRWALVSDVLFGSILFTIYFKMGKWKNKNV